MVLCGGMRGVVSRSGSGKTGTNFCNAASQPLTWQTMQGWVDVLNSPGLNGSGSKPKACNKAGAHTRDIPRYKENVAGARLAREALQF